MSPDPMVGCRFNGAGMDLLGGIENETGYPNAWMYHCTLCGKYHWTMPALEIDGTADTEAAGSAQQDAVIEQFYGKRIPVITPAGGNGPVIDWP